MNQLRRWWLNRFYHLPRAVLANWRYGLPASKLSVTAVTGTDGKTTTVWGIYHLCQLAGSRVAMISTVKASWPGYETDTGLHVTTPDEWQMQARLRQIVQAGSDSLVLEVSSHGIDQYRVWGIRPTVAVLTNIARDHLDYHANWQDYRQTKAKLLRLAARVVINPETVDDWQWWRNYLLRYNSNARIMTYGFSPGAELRAENVRYHPNGMSFDLVQMDFRRRIKLPLFGQHNLLNALAVAAVGRQWRIVWSVIVRALRSYPAIPGRWQLLPLPGRRKVMVDFAHTPQGIGAVLQSVHDHFSRRSTGLITVLGSASQRDAGKRPDMGRQAMSHSRWVIVTEDDSRHEPREEIIHQIAQGCADAGGRLLSRQEFLSSNTAGYILVPDRKQAIRLALEKSSSHNFVAILGKGHEQSLAVKGVEIPWSDVRVVKQLARQLLT